VTFSSNADRIYNEIATTTSICNPTKKKHISSFCDVILYHHFSYNPITDELTNTKFTIVFSLGMKQPHNTDTIIPHATLTTVFSSISARPGLSYYIFFWSSKFSSNYTLKTLNE